jgi:hypothetical protein
MNKGNIKALSHNAARLLLVYHYCDGTERLSDLPALMAQAGLTSKQYRHAFKQLQDLHFITLEPGSICLSGDEAEEVQV